jgi:hypothetical protein
MATQAQIDANRRNAQHSTGPKTEAGKAKSSRNATRFGLFATNACILPGEQEAYDEMCHTLWDDLAPVGGLEEVTAAEYVRATWRLRRCAIAEEQLAACVVADQARKDKFSFSGEYTPPLDPILSNPRDTRAIDRAVAQAQNAQKRALAELRKLQAARLAAEKQTEADPAPPQDATEEPTQFAAPRGPRVLNFPCTCGSSKPYDRCCGAMPKSSKPIRPAA